MAENKYSRRGMMKNQYLNVKGQLEGGIKIKEARAEFIFLYFSAEEIIFSNGILVQRSIYKTCRLINSTTYIIFLNRKHFNL